MSNIHNIRPENFKEAVISAIPNCTTMVLGMMTLNLWIYGHLSVHNFFAALVPIYLTAFTLDFFIVGPIVMKIVNRYSVHKFMPLIRVGLMAGILTGLAPVIETGFLPNLSQYLVALPRNYIVALLLQVLIAYKFGVYVLVRYRMVKSSINISK
ncbi:MAG: DUF2798 domain-containing protein [Alphaproteobacteria bacterium]|nr:DUF2798 domain-containing protein [Alphaproteobacteria bacterium]